MQTDTHENNCNDIKYGGSIQTTANVHYGHDEKEVIRELKDAVKRSGKTIPSLDFPLIKEDPINEYGGNLIFAGAFPWLFPGGLGDITDPKAKHKPNIDIWLERLIRYYDCRFQNDKMFCFYANDYCQRKLTNSNAGWFVHRKYPSGNVPHTLNDLKKQILNGNYTYLTKLLYFSGSIRGSDSFWRRKKWN